jgi:hypothetical protein
MSRGGPVLQGQMVVSGEHHYRRRTYLALQPRRRRLRRSCPREPSKASDASKEGGDRPTDLASYNSSAHGEDGHDDGEARRR